MADITVTTLTDVVDANDNLLSLREALTQAANSQTNPGVDRILFDSSLANGTITLNAGLGRLSVDSNLTINGHTNAASGGTSGAITIDGGDATALFYVGPAGFGSAPTATLTGLTLTNGRVQGTVGGGGLYGGGGGGGGAGLGGALYVGARSNLTIGDVAFGGSAAGSGNEAYGGAGGSVSGSSNGQGFGGKGGYFPLNSNASFNGGNGGNGGYGDTAAAAPGDPGGAGFGGGGGGGRTNGGAAGFGGGGGGGGGLANTSGGAGGFGGAAGSLGYYSPGMPGFNGVGASAPISMAGAGGGGAGLGGSIFVSDIATVRFTGNVSFNNGAATGAGGAVGAGSGLFLNSEAVTFAPTGFFGQITVNDAIADTGAAGVIVAGSSGGSLVLAAVNTYTSATTVSSGVLSVTGSIAGSATVVSNGATLAGTGTTGAVTLQSGAALAPGPYIPFFVLGFGGPGGPGSSGGGSSGTLSTGNLGLVSGASYNVDVNSASAGQFDQVHVLGTVSLGGATLNLNASSSFTPTTGQTFIIVDNDGTDAVVGTFANLPEGSSITSQGHGYSVSYVGNTGNDVVLTALPPAPVNTVPGAQTVAEDASLSITGLSVSDADSTQTNLTTTLTVSHGALTVLTAGGAAVSGSGTATVSLTGTTAQINTTLSAADNVVYRDAQDLNGAETLTVATTDNKATGAQTDTDTVSINVTQVNDTPVPVNDVLSTVNEDSPQRYIDASTLTGNDGKGAPNESGLTITDVSNAVGGTVFYDGEGGVYFTPTANYNGAASFDYTVQDNGQTNGVDDFKSATGHASFTINAVNDAPVFTSPTVAVSRVSTSATGVQGLQSDNGAPNFFFGSSETIRFSPDGTKVVFSSNASNLVAGDTNGSQDVFVKDLTGGAVTLISTGANGQSDGYSSNARFSADGHKVVFESYADNLVTGDTNRQSDIFVRDLVGNTTTRVSTSSSGVESNGYTFGAVFSPDGGKVAFVSNASNLVADDTNNTQDIFIKDLTTQELTRISVGASGEANSYSESPVFSPDGTKLAFISAASNLVDGDTNSAQDVFVVDLGTHVVTRVSTDGTGAQSSGYSSAPVFLSNGKIAFVSSATDLVAGGNPNGASQIFVKDLNIQAVTQVTSTAYLGEGGGFSNLSASADGHRIAFDSGAGDLVSGDTNNNTDVFVEDLTTGVTTRVSVSGTGAQSNNYSFFGDISPDGSKVAFLSNGTNLVSGDTNGTTDAFVSTLLPLPNYSGGPGVAPASQATVSDVDNANFAGGSFSASVTGSAVGDALSIRSSTTAGQGIVDGDSGVTFNGAVIGNLSTSGTSFTVALNSNATPAAVQALTQAVVFSTTAFNGVARAVHFTLNDGSGTANGGVDTASFDATITVATPVSGTSGADTLNGGPGSDRITGGGGADILTGGAGADIFVYTSVNDTPLSGRDLITDFHSGQDVIDLSGADAGFAALAYSGDETFLSFGTPTSSGYPDQILVHGHVLAADLRLSANAGLALFGGTSAEVLGGGPGADLIIGGGGADILTGGAGADTFYYGSLDDSRVAAHDIITDFQSGQDKINLSAVDGGSVAIAYDGAKSYVAFGAPTASGYSDVVAVQGRVGVADLFLSSSVAGVALYGASAAETLVGGSGADLIIGGGGADILTGGAGADTFYYGSLDDSRVAAYDIITDFQGGQDKINLSAVDGGSVSIAYDGVNSFVAFGASNAPGGLDLVAVQGRVGVADLILSSPTTGVVLYGASTAETLVGGSGADLIIGGGGADTLTGGAGADTFYYGALSDSPLNAGDRITDFQSGLDKIDLRSLHTGGADKYTIDVQGAQTFLYFDQGGDGTNELAILLSGANALNGSDVLF